MARRRQNQKQEIITVGELLKFEEVKQDFREVAIKSAQNCCGISFWNKSSEHQRNIEIFLEKIEGTKCEPNSIEEVLFELVLLATKANDNRAFASLRVYRSPLSDFLSRLRETILNSIENDIPDLFSNIQKRAEAYYEEANRVYTAAKDFQKNFQSERTQFMHDYTYQTIQNLQEQYQQNRMDGMPITYQLSRSKDMGLNVIEMNSKGKKTYQDSLRQYDDLIRKASALGNKKAENIALHYGLLDSLSFKPNGSWWNLSHS